MDTEDITARQKADRFPERLRELLFLKVAHQDPIVQNDDAMGSYECYWCSSSEFSRLECVHKNDCLWIMVKETYDKTFMTRTHET